MSEEQSITVDGVSYRFRSDAPDPVAHRDCCQRLIDRLEAESRIKELDRLEHEATGRIWFESERRYMRGDEIAARLAEMEACRKESEDAIKRMRVEVRAEERLRNQPAPEGVM